MGELCEARSAVNDMTTINSKAGADKRHLEGAIHTMHAEIDDMLSQAKNSEEKAKKAMADAARLADELRAEQDHAGSQEKAKRCLEAQILELEQRLSEANDMASKGGRNAMAKLESRIRELEIELGSVQCKTSETYKSFQKAERRVKELQFQQAEEIAALNLAKYRKAQQGLEEAEERAKMAGTTLSMTGARAGSVL